MSIIAVNSMDPLLEIQVPQRNFEGAKSLIQIPPVEGTGAFGGSDVAGNQMTATFNIASNNSFFCPDESYFTGDIYMGTTGTFAGDVNCVINQVQIQIGSGSPFLDTAPQGHAIWSRIQDIVAIEPGYYSTPIASEAQKLWQQSKNDLLQADAGRKVYTASGIKRIIRPAVPFLEHTHTFPSQVAGVLQIRLTFATSALCCASYASTGYYIKNLQYNAVFQPCNSQYNQKLREVARESGIMVPFTAPQFVPFNMFQTTANSFTCNTAFKWCKRLEWVVRNVANIASQPYDNLGQYLVPPSGIALVQAQLGSRMYPSNPIYNTTVGYTEMLKAKKKFKYGSGGNGITEARYTTAAYQSSTNQSTQSPLNVMSLDTSCARASSEGDMFTGVSSQDGPATLVYNTVAAAAANSELDLYLVCDYILVVRDYSVSTLVGGQT